MKSTFYAIALLICLSSCSLFRNPATLTSTSLDYSTYNNKGFFLTESNSVNFSYEPIASLSAINISGYRLSDKPGKTFTDDIYGTSIEKSPATTNEYIRAKKEVALDELYKKAIASGSNGIINLQVRFITITSAKGVTDWGYEATGMAIKK